MNQQKFPNFSFPAMIHDIAGYLFTQATVQCKRKVCPIKVFKMEYNLRKINYLLLINFLFRKLLFSF